MAVSNSTPLMAFTRARDLASCTIFLTLGLEAQSPMVDSCTRKISSGEKATARTVEACPVSVPRSIASPTLQIRTVLSYPHDAMVWPSGEIATALIRPECPVKHHHRTVEQRGKYVLTLLRDGNAQHLRRTM